MAAMSQYLESGILYHLFRTATFPKPPTIAIALCSGTVVNTDTGSLVGKEIGGGGAVAPSNAYARQLLAPLDANWSAISQVAGSGDISNLSAITFPAATTTNWGTITDVAILDSGVYGSGNVLLFGKLASSKIINIGDTFKFNISDVNFYNN